SKRLGHLKSLRGQGTCGGVILSPATGDEILSLHPDLGVFVMNWGRVFGYKPFFKSLPRGRPALKRALFEIKVYFLPILLGQFPSNGFFFHHRALDYFKLAPHPRQSVTRNGAEI